MSATTIVEMLIAGAPTLIGRTILSWGRVSSVGFGPTVLSRRRAACVIGPCVLVDTDDA